MKLPLKIFAKARFLALLILTQIANVVVAADDYPFSVRGDRQPDGITTTLVASNRGPATIAVKVTAWGTNLGSNKSFPLVARVPAYTDLQLGHLFPAQPGSASFSWSTEFLVGDLNVLYARLGLTGLRDLD
jgi:hypothetical protein